MCRRRTPPHAAQAAALGVAVVAVTSAMRLQAVQQTRLMLVWLLRQARLLVAAAGAEAAVVAAAVVVAVAVRVPTMAPLHQQQPLMLPLLLLLLRMAARMTHQWHAAQQLLVQQPLMPVAAAVGRVAVDLVALVLQEQQHQARVGMQPPPVAQLLALLSVSLKRPVAAAAVVLAVVGLRRRAPATACRLSRACSPPACGAAT